MSTPFYDLASLVVVPSGVKAQKVYAQKPMTTDGQLAFSRASTATRVNASGLIETVASNVPRLDYLGSSCPRLLLEPQRTNLLIYSENSALWQQPADGLTVVYNTTETLDPAGFNGAEKVTFTGGNGRMFEAVVNAFGSVTMSAFVKAGTGNTIRLRTTSSAIIVDFNLTTQTITSTFGTGTITNYGNGWYRVTATGTSATTPEVAQYIFPNTAGQFVYFYGAQFEQGAYATSYIPTLGSASTRGSDAASKTGISSLIGQTEGTLFFDIAKVYKDGARSISIVWGGGASYIQIFLVTDIRVIVNGTLIMQGVTIAENTRYKLAIAYKNGSHAMYVNGVQIATSASSVAPTVLNDYYLGNAFSTEQSGVYSQALVFKTRLPNSELAKLTSL